MKKVIDYIENCNFTAREILLIGISLFLGGTLIGTLISPKGFKVSGCYNGSGNGSNNEGCSPETKLGNEEKAR